MIYYNEVTATIDKFETYAYAEVLWTDTYQFCYNLGWGTEKVIMAIDTAMSFKDCYKRFIETFGDLDAWLALDAKIPDECVDSQAEQVQVFEYIPYATASETYWVGDGTKTSTTCIATGL